jgi:hypothetical protein
MFNQNGKIYMMKKHLATLQTNRETLLFCRKLLCRKLLQVSEYGPRQTNLNPGRGYPFKLGFCHVPYEG